MTIGLTVAKIEKITVEGVRSLSALCDVSENGVVVRQVRHGYPIDTPEAEIRADLTRVKAGLQRDADVAEEKAGDELAEKNANETIDALTGAEL
jgi:hypothetical protein